MRKVLVIVGVVFLGAFSAQNASAQSANIVQKIIGTWVDPDGSTWVFNANGTLTMDGTAGKFGVADTKMVIALGRELVVCDISISSDGKTLLLTFMRNGSSSCLWLTKK